MKIATGFFFILIGALFMGLTSNGLGNGGNFIMNSTGLLVFLGGTNMLIKRGAGLK
ncbi:hypothetical protein [Cytobacillus purgationiresistens]|uniref:Uncharacterized protein n=1 Tax=Cytobacillus purgationiresistens TaxID=863449 RepID=A0ABU0AKX7_9BACI|nr:hypothetical protein [Cytobacillus purgationiresistens]MDQ0271695.1 hypothetical protein [Cytobacillus purgationiresistens]